MAIKFTSLIRRDPAATWASVNPILGTSEPALETDTKRVKYGDGVTAYNDLPYSSMVPVGGTTGQALLKYSNNDYERSEEHTSELQSLMRISYAVFCLKKKTTKQITIQHTHTTSTNATI